MRTNTLREEAHNCNCNVISETAQILAQALGELGDVANREDERMLFAKVQEYLREKGREAERDGRWGDSGRFESERMRLIGIKETMF